MRTGDETRSNDAILTNEAMTGVTVPRNTFKRAMHQTWILMERNMINYSRNLLAYGIRLAMYSESSFILVLEIFDTVGKIN